MKNIKLEYAKKLFEILKCTTEVVDKYIILDYYILRAIQYVRYYIQDEATEFSGLLRQFMEECSQNNYVKDLEMFFFALANFIDNNVFFVVNAHKRKNSEHIRSFADNLKEIVENSYKTNQDMSNL